MIVERQGQGVSGDESGEAGRDLVRERYKPCLGTWNYPTGNEEPLKGVKGFKQECHMITQAFLSKTCAEFEGNNARDKLYYVRSLEEK